MIKEEFKEMKKELERKNEQREKHILESRKLLQKSKKAMYQTHRNNLERAEEVLKEAKVIVDFLQKEQLTENNKKTGAINAALQEWAESYAYYTYAKEKRLLTKKETNLTTENYLLALSDLTGELTRKAVLESINKKTDEVKEIRQFVDDLLGEFLEFDFRNGELRKKTDQIRWNLQKIEELLVRI